MCVESIPNEPTSTSCNTYKTYVKQKNKKEPSGMQQLENERKEKKEKKKPPVVEFFLMVDLWPCHNQFRSCFEHT